MVMRIRGLRKQRRRERDPHGNEYRMSGPGRRACTQSFFRFIERNWFQQPKRSMSRKKFGQCRKFPRKMWEFPQRSIEKYGRLAQSSWEKCGSTSEVPHSASAMSGFCPFGDYCFSQSSTDLISIPLSVVPSLQWSATSSILGNASDIASRGAISR